MRHPHLKLLGHALKENGVASGSALAHCLAIFMFESGHDGPTKNMGHFLHAITNAQYGNVFLADQIPHGWRNVRSPFFVDRIRPSRQDNGNDFMFIQILSIYKTRVEFTVDMEFSDTTGNQMGILRAKVENGNLRPARLRCCEIHCEWGSKETIFNKDIQASSDLPSIVAQPRGLFHVFGCLHDASLDNSLQLNSTILLSRTARIY
jgi:hypothetical protein